MNIQDVTRFGIKLEDVKIHLEKIKNRESLVIVTGEFSAGKSAFLNAFLGIKGFLPEAMNECTPVIVDLMQSDSCELIIKYKNGEQEKNPATPENIQHFTRNIKGYDQEILAISIPVQSAYLEPKVHLIDTPGTSTILKEHEQITEYILKQADIVLYAINKSLGESDFAHINKVLRYTDEIIFIITHIDEVDVKEQLSQGRYKSKETILRFIEEAKTSIIAKCGIELPEIFVVGSKEALVDDLYIAPIRQCVYEYVEMNGLEVIQKRVQKQLDVVFNQHLQKLQQEIDFFLSNMDIDKVEVQEKRLVLEKNADRLNVKQLERVQKSKEVLERQKERAAQAVRKMIEDKRTATTQNLARLNELTPEKVEQILSEINKDLGGQLRAIIEKNINEYKEYVFHEVNIELQETLSEVDFRLDTQIKPPNLEALDQEPGDFQYSIRETERMIESCIQDMQMFEDEIGTSEQEKVQIRNKLEQTEQELQTLRTSFRELGHYIPLYEGMVVDGGGKAGAVVGRVIGEVADLALLFIPVGAAAKGTTTALRAADMAKDAVKSVSYVERATRGARMVLENGKNVKEGLEKIKQTGQKVIVAGGKAKEIMQENPDKFSKLGDMLDMLSLGHWGEKLGQAIGESIQTTSTMMVENLENKKAWESQRETIEYEMSMIQQQKTELQKVYEKAESIREKRQKMKQIEERKQQYEAMALQLEQKTKQHQEESLKMACERHYSEQIAQIFNDELQTIITNCTYVLENAADKIIAKSIEAQDERLQELMGQMALLAKRKEEIDAAIKDKQELLEDLKLYHQWIEQWVQEYAVS